MDKYSIENRVKLIYRAENIKNNQPICDTTHLKNIYLDANSIGIALDTKIYRIFPYKWLLQALQTSTLHFVRPEEWADPYENFLLRAKGILDNGQEVGLDMLKDRVFAQCWSTKAECDGLWRTYSIQSRNRKFTREVAIKVETTVGKLFNEFYDMNNISHQLSYFVGKVQYVSDKTLLKFLKKDILMDTSGMGPILALLLKRKAFSYEKEIRFIFRDMSTCVNSFYSCSFPFNKIVDNITIEPWASTLQTKKIISSLSMYYSGNIVQDSLYKETNFIIKL